MCAQEVYRCARVRECDTAHVWTSVRVDSVYVPVSTFLCRPFTLRFWSPCVVRTRVRECCVGKCTHVSKYVYIRVPPGRNGIHPPPVDVCADVGTRLDRPTKEK